MLAFIRIVYGLIREVIRNPKFIKEELKKYFQRD
jgi:hypothetical protein